MTGRRPARVVVLSPGWASLDQCAVRLARCGADVVHLRLDEHGGPLRLESWVYPRHRVTDRAGLPAALTAAGPDDIVDILAPEEWAGPVAAAAEQAGVSPSVLAELRRRVTAADKGVWPALLAAHGVPVPRTLAAGSVAAATAAGSLGLPMIAKPCRGAAGEGVARLDTVDDVAGVVRRGREAPGSWLLQELLDGDVCQYVAAVRDGEVVLEGQYATRVRSARAFGPGAVAHLTDDPALADVGRRAVWALGGRGLVNVETVRDRSGTHRVIDVNPRPWALFAEFVRVGYPFDRAYLAAVDAAVDTADTERVDRAGRVAAGRSPAGTELEVFPPGGDVLAREGRAAVLRRTARLAPRSVRLLGSGYTALAVASVAGRALSRTRPR